MKHSKYSYNLNFFVVVVGFGCDLIMFQCLILIYSNCRMGLFERK